MKKSITRIIVTFFLMISMMLTLAVSVAASSPKGEIGYDRQTYASPDGISYLLVTKQLISGKWDIIALAVGNVISGTVISSENIHIQGEIGVYWSPDSTYVAVEMPQDPYCAQTVLVLFADPENAGVFHSASTQSDYEWIRETSTSDLPPVDEITLSAALIEGWRSPTQLGVITEYVLGHERIWSRRVFDMEQRKLVIQERGDALNLDDPKNPIWKRAEALSSPDNNQGYCIYTPDNRYCVTVESAYLRSDRETWNSMYESIYYSENGFVRKEYDLDVMHAAWVEDASYYDRPFWNHLSLKISPDSRYLIVESADTGAYPFYIDLNTQNSRILPSAEIRLDAVGHGNATVYTEAFSVFGEAVVIVCEEDGSRSREIFDLETGTIGYVQTGDADDTAFSYTPHKSIKRLKDSFKGYIAISKTHTNGLDGLFRIGDDYKYLHMETVKNEDGTSSYREYVCNAVVFSGSLSSVPDGYREIYSREGCWVLDENDRVVYAGTGVVRSCGNFTLAINQHMVTPIDTIITGKRLFDSTFRLVLDRVLDTAAQSDGSVYVKHTVGKGGFAFENLSYIAADGTRTNLGRYTGDLGEFRG